MAGQYTSKWNSPEDWSECVEWLAAGLHGRSRWRLPLIMTGLLLANGRRTVTSWIRAGGLQKEFRHCYYFLESVGRRTERVAHQLLQLLLDKFSDNDRVLLALDDSSTKRYGCKVQGAGLHRNPTSGPDDHKFIYGHSWVTLAWITRHPLWGTLTLPLWARLYVKQKDVETLAEYGWEFQTKLQLAAGMVKQAASVLQKAGKKVWLVMDGAYAYRPLLREILPLGIVVVSRLRKDAALRTVPQPPKTKARGGKRKYGKQAISLTKKACERDGWQEFECVLYGESVTKTCKTFLATYAVVGALLRVVLVREGKEWEVFFCTDPEASVPEILEAYADRSSIEQVFHDLKEIWGASQQQVRKLWSNLGAFHMNLWSYTLVELWGWSRPWRTLCDRSASPWDDSTRRPSHADRRRALCMQIIQHEFNVTLGGTLDRRRIKKLFKTLAQMAT